MLLEHQSRPKAPGDISVILTENDVQCPQPTHSLGTRTLPNLFGSGTVWTTAHSILMSIWHKDCQSKTKCDTIGQFLKIFIVLSKLWYLVSEHLICDIHCMYGCDAVQKTCDSLVSYSCDIFPFTDIFDMSYAS